MSARAAGADRRRIAVMAAVAFLGSSVLLVAAPVPTARAVTIGNPSNATLRTGNEDESAIAVNPANAQQIAVMTNGVAGDAGLPLSISTNGGQTWTRTIFATGTGGGGDGRPAACCDPTLAWDNFGNLFVGYLFRTGANLNIRSIELYVTTDLGANFTNLGPVDQHTTDTTPSLDQPTVVAGAGAVWMTWRDDSGGIAAIGRGVTGALTFGAWGAEQDVSNVGNFGDIAIGPTGEVMVTYQTPTGNEGPSTIFVHTDADGLGAGGFGGAVNVTTTNVGGFDFLPAQPQRSVDAEAGLAWDRTGGANNDRVYLVYNDENPAESNDFDVFVRTSTNDGANWSAPVQVNDDAGTNSQMLPKIALDQSSGQVGATWYDARGDTGGGPSATDIDGTANNDVTLFASWSSDGGATWAANVAVADAPTDGYNYNGAQELGDFTGAAFGGGILYPSWADSSNSTGDNPDGARASYDVYTAAVRPNNLPPVVSVASASGTEGAAIALAGSANDPNGDPLTFSWSITPDGGNDVGSGCAITSGGTTLTPTIRCSDDGTYTATLTATGDPAGPVSASNTVTVSNANPSVTSPAATPATIDEGQSTTFGASFSDPGWNDTYTGSIDWGFGPPEAVAPSVTTPGSPGVPDSGTITGTHAYMDDGGFTVTGTVTDDDGGSGSASAVVTVNNVDPTAAIDESGTVLINGVPTIITNAGTPVPFSGRSTDPGSDDLTLTWDWDDGPPAPDVTVVSLHAPPNPDADPSPDGTARDVTDSRTHTFGEACFYDVTFASADDDGGTGSDDIAVVIVGNFADTRSHGYFKTELAKLKDHTAAGAQCLLDITGFMSKVFNEVRNASTPAAAIAVFNKSGSSLAADIFDVQLLAAWMNFADGRVALTDLVDTNKDHVPDTAFATLVAQAEAVRLNPASTRAQILAQKDRLESFNLSGI
jgi:hypothetical protein